MSQGKKMLLLDAGGEKTPTQVTGLWQWLKADAGITKDGSNFVSAWADQSGNGRNMTQSTVGIKPKWTAASSFDGLLPCLDFDGDDYLDGGAIGPASGTNSRCIMVAMTSLGISGSGYNHVLHYGTDQDGQAYGMTTRGYAPHTTTVGPGNHYWGSGMADDVAAPSSGVFTVYFNNPTDTLRINRAAVCTATPTINTVTNDIYRIGGRVGVVDEYLNAFVGEILVYAPAPSLADIAALETYLMNRWL